MKIHRTNSAGFTTVNVQELLKCERVKRDIAALAKLMREGSPTLRRVAAQRARRERQEGK